MAHINCPMALHGRETTAVCTFPACMCFPQQSKADDARILDLERRVMDLERKMRQLVYEKVV